MFYDDDYYYENDEAAASGCMIVIVVFFLIIYVILAVLAGSFALGAFIGLAMALFNYAKAVKMSLDNQPSSGVFNMDDGFAQKAKAFGWRLRDVFRRANQQNLDKEAEIKEAHSNDSNSIVARGVKGAFYIGRVIGLIVGGLILNIALTILGASLILLAMGIVLVARGVSYVVGFVLGFVQTKYGGNDDV